MPLSPAARSPAVSFTAEERGFTQICHPENQPGDNQEDNSREAGEAEVGMEQLQQGLRGQS